jgi:hypothetical protein
MPADLLKLDALTRTAIRTATDAYLAGGSIETWQRDMQRAITRGHTASTLAGIAERLGIPLDKDLISEKRLSRAERNEIKQSVAKQLEYLRGFVEDVQAGKLSEKQIRARADLYGGAIRGTYSQARWLGIPLPFHPTEGTQCQSNDRCSWEVVKLEGNGNYDAYWRLGATERHCTTCPERASANPYQIRNGQLV